MTADRVLDELRRHGELTLEGYKITRLQHGLQSATRAEEDGVDIDWIVGALLHDIGDGLAPQNHDRFSAEVVRPFVRWEVSWVIEHHGIFQMLYYAHHYGWDKDARDRYRDHPCFDTCAKFCERWDQSSFDPDYPTKPLERKPCFSLSHGSHRCRPEHSTPRLAQRSCTAHTQRFIAGGPTTIAHLPLERERWLDSEPRAQIFMWSFITI